MNKFALVILLLLTALLVTAQGCGKKTTTGTKEPGKINVDQDVNEVGQGISEIDDIEKDLNMSDMDDLEKELDEINW